MYYLNEFDKFLEYVSYEIQLPKKNDNDKT